MSRRHIIVLLIGLITLNPVSSPAQEERDRNKIPDKYKWDLTHIYSTDDAWQKEKESLVAELPGIESFKGKLGSSPQEMLAGLNYMFDLVKKFRRLAAYAGMSSDQDTRNSKYLAMQQEIGQIATTFSAKTAFVEPEILKLDKATVDDYILKEKGLGVYRHYLHDILRRQEHTGTEAEEKIIADAGLMSATTGSVYNVFSNADFPFPTITLSDGRDVKIDKAAFNLYRASSSRDDRRKVFAAYFGSLNDYRRTFGANLYGEVKKNMFYARANKYGSALERALDANNIPLQVYKNLVDNVNANLATFHRYLQLRKRIMGLDTLHYYDLYAPLLEEVDLQYTVEEAREHIVASLAPLGKEYIAVVNRAFDERWLDMFPNDGKRAGAYSQGAAYDVHPYMLLNYNGKYDDMSTLTHELGHTMQSFLSNKKQPYPTARYPTFVAEVASTFNEALLIDHMLKKIKKDAVRLSLLGNQLESIKGTFFRQTQFAEFELRIHEMAEKGEPLTGDKVNEVYDEITKKYYGHDKGICIVDNEIKAEWANIPHFYLNFYVYQYATSYTASEALSEQVLAGDKAATKRYLDFLSAGGSKYPIDLLKEAGVDMTTSRPFELTMNKMNRIMDEMEKILVRMKK